MCCANHDWPFCANAKRVALMRHLANPALNLQVEASNAAAPELAGVVVPHKASIQMHAAQNQIFGLVRWHGAPLARSRIGMAGICGGSDKVSRSKSRLQTAGVDPIQSCGWISALEVHPRHERQIGAATRLTGKRDLFGISPDCREAVIGPYHVGPGFNVLAALRKKLGALAVREPEIVFCFDGIERGYCPVIVLQHCIAISSRGCCHTSKGVNWTHQLEESPRSESRAANFLFAGRWRPAPESKNGIFYCNRPRSSY